MNDSGLLSLIYMLSGGKWPQAKIASPDHARILVSAVAVAQLVESRIVIPVVAGSSPVSHPISKDATFGCIATTPPFSLFA